MADQFDIVDIVYNAVEPASTGFILYKDQSGDGEKRNHITIRSLALNGKDYVNKGSININIFVKRPSKGVSDRQLMIETVRGVRFVLRDIKPPLGCIGNLGSSGLSLWARPRMASIVRILD